MKRNFSAVVKDYDGHAKVRSTFQYTEDGLPICDETGQLKFKAYEAMTLRLYALDALSGRWPGEEAMTPKQSRERMDLHDKICFGADEAGQVELKAEDGPLILEALRAQHREHLVVARMQQMLDTDPKPVEAQAVAG